MNDKLTKDEVYKVLTKLIGDIEPVADAAIDSERLENMTTFIEVFNRMYSHITDIANKYVSSPYGSERKAGQLCFKYLLELETNKSNLTYYDLFDNYDLQPSELKNIISKYSISEDMTYIQLQALLEEVNNIGYTFDYGLDGVPYGLRPIGVKLENLSQ